MCGFSPAWSRGFSSGFLDDFALDEFFGEPPHGGGGNVRLFGDLPDGELFFPDHDGEDFDLFHGGAFEAVFFEYFEGFRLFPPFFRPASRNINSLEKAGNMSC